ncbi:MAG TPA: hypothetical protein VGT41_06170 [Candidatus Babeliales bacterium]|nr:hypothetical protein [Candidatus Babeliales bacterium]
MKQYELLEREHALLKHLAQLPRKILTLHGRENVTEFVLHDLCDINCFNLNKAAYFIDNPDFNITKGVAGFSRSDVPINGQMAWKDPVAFSQHMAQSEFNKKVRKIMQGSLSSEKHDHEKIAGRLADELGFNNHAFCNVTMKHDNHGFVLYEKVNTHDTFADDHMVNGLSLLGFCPIF